MYGPRTQYGCPTRTGLAKKKAAASERSSLGQRLPQRHGPLDEGGCPACLDLTSSMAALLWRFALSRRLAQAMWISERIRLQISHGPHSANGCPSEAGLASVTAALRTRGSEQLKATVNSRVALHSRLYQSSRLPPTTAKAASKTRVALYRRLPGVRGSHTGNGCPGSMGLPSSQAH